MDAATLVVMGVSGSGKSTVAALLAARLGRDFLEGDDVHPAANVAKMAAGVPLDDADRAPWLDALARWIRERTAAGRPGVLSCSALTRGYRDVLRTGGPVVFVHLTGSRDELARRMAARVGHFMPATLLDSQLAVLEPPGPDEDAVTVPIAATPDEQVRAVVDALDFHP